jgi:hypothetical protein
MRMTEEWRAVPEFEGRFEISDQGRFRSVAGLYPTKNGWRKRDESRLWNPAKDRLGYYRVSLMLNGKSVARFIHRLVLQAFAGAAPDGCVACHCNGITTDNRLSNLRWDTLSANQKDAVAHGTKRTGDLSPSSRLLDADILRIREMLLYGAIQTDVAAVFGMHRNTVSNLHRGTYRVAVRVTPTSAIREASTRKETLV